MTKDNAISVRDLIEAGKCDQAFDLLKNAAVTDETVTLYCDLGQRYRDAANFDRAISSLEKAMSYGPRNARPRAMMAEICLVAGFPAQAIEYMGQAMTMAPDNREYRQKLLLLLSETEVVKFNPLLKKTVGESLRMGGLDLTEISDLWVGLLRQDPAYKELYKAGQKDDYGFFLKAFARIRPQDRKALAEIWFLDGLRTLTVYTEGFEKFATYLCHLILDCQRGAQDLLTPEIVAALAPAMAQYAFYTEYIFAVEPEEQTAVYTLRKGIEQGGNEAQEATALAVLACYMPLPQSADIPALDPEIRAAHFTDVKERAALKNKIESITQTVDAVSLCVQQQYEDFPYPAWRGFLPLLKDQEIEGSLAGKKAKILIAGTGTGKEAIELAGALPDADITAIDLSRASLAYGMHMAQRAGIRNIRFAQADINELPDDLGPFDYVTSSGVLHHMADPMKGWRKITKLLKPGGLMRIALYSRTARRYINEARAVIAAKGLANDAPTIRDFRAKAAELLDKDACANLHLSRDYYQMSECRDLLFHVQEHQFDIPQIKAALAELELEFKRFYLPLRVMQAYAKKYPDDAGLTDLDNWAAFEEKNPNTFVSMYRFWCVRA